MDFHVKFIENNAATSFKPGFKLSLNKVEFLWHEFFSKDTGTDWILILAFGQISVNLNAGGVLYRLTLKKYPNIVDRSSVDEAMLSRQYVLFRLTSVDVRTVDYVWTQVKKFIIICSNSQINEDEIPCFDWDWPHVLLPIYQARTENNLHTIYPSTSSFMFILKKKGTLTAKAVGLVISNMNNMQAYQFSTTRSEVLIGRNKKNQTWY
jgi:hypothetical protein